MRYPQSVPNPSRMRPGEVRERLLGEGRCFASRARLCAMLGVTAEALPSSLRRAVARGDFVRVCRGGWVARDDVCKSMGRPLPDLALYVDDMMRHLGHLLACPRPRTSA